MTRLKKSFEHADATLFDILLLYLQGATAMRNLAYDPDHLPSCLKETDNFQFRKQYAFFFFFFLQRMPAN